MANTATSSPSGEESVPQSRLLKLPRELRNMIYRLLLSQPLDPMLTNPQQVYKGCCLDFNFPLPVLLINHQIRTEFTEEVLQKLPVMLQVRCNEYSDFLGSSLKVCLGKLWPEVHIVLESIEATKSLQPPTIALASGLSQLDSFGIMRLTIKIPKTTCMTRLEFTRIPEIVSEVTRARYELTVTSKPVRKKPNQARVTSSAQDRQRRFSRR